MFISVIATIFSGWDYVKNGKELASKIKKFMNMNEKEKEKILDEAYETAKKYDVIKLREKLINIFGTKKED